ncbi:MAG: hypothetical protein LBR80_17920 [Deltaproteobacteria bacterium]|jgi:energy-coupling factor transport system permease protein|nr:hypothetical protein [Deltaproteobacteria bacterium]
MTGSDASGRDAARAIAAGPEAGVDVAGIAVAASAGAEGAEANSAFSGVDTAGAASAPSGVEEIGLAAVASGVEAAGAVGALAFDSVSGAAAVADAPMAAVTCPAGVAPDAACPTEPDAACPAEAAPVVACPAEAAPVAACPIEADPDAGGPEAGGPLAAGDFAGCVADADALMGGRPAEESAYHGAPVKLVFAAGSSVLALLFSSWQPLALLALFSLLWSAGRVRLSLLVKAHLLVFALLALCVLGASYLPSIPGLRRGGGVSVRATVLPALRVAVSLNMTLALVLSSPASALSRFTAALRLPDAIFVPVSVVLRFVGVFVSELTQVKEALMARTGQTPLRTALTRPWRLWRGFFTPMVFRALASSDSLALALEMKGLRARSLFWERPPLLPPGDRRRLAAGLAAMALCVMAQYRDAVVALAARVLS